MEGGVCGVGGLKLCCVCCPPSPQPSPLPLPPLQDEPLRFDRILADVPCSGDGTLRKVVLASFHAYLRLNFLQFNAPCFLSVHA